MTSADGIYLFYLLADLFPFFSLYLSRLIPLLSYFFLSFLTIKKVIHLIVVERSITITSVDGIYVLSHYLSFMEDFFLLVILFF